MNAMASGNCIVSFGCNDLRYKTMLNRLSNSLKKAGWTGGFEMEWFENYPFHNQVPYVFKTDKLNTLKQYKDLLWLDSSFYAIKSPEWIFGRIDEQGYYFSESGYNCAQSVSDACLKLFDITRDEAEGIKEVSSGCVGINQETMIGRELLEMWSEYTEMGGTKGSRFHDNQSTDKRFLFHRQDQSVLSLCAYKLGLRPTRMGEYWDYLTDKDIESKRELKETVCFICRGI